MVSCEWLLKDINCLLPPNSQSGPFYARLMGERVIDVLYHLPVEVQNRQKVDYLSEAHFDHLVTFEATVSKHERPYKPAQPHKIIVINSAQQCIELVFFNSRSAYLNSLAKIGQPIGVSGKLERAKASAPFKLVHPDYLGPIGMLKEWVGPERVFPLGLRVNQKMVRALVKSVLSRTPELNEWLDPGIKHQHNWPSWCQALFKLHQATTLEELGITQPARQRLIYDEMLAYHLSLRLTQTQFAKVTTSALSRTNQLIVPLKASLPFHLTPYQNQAFEEISQDLAHPYQTLRLLQGDVGSGKTLVALLAALQAIEAGFQVAFLVPTDLLARQHLQTLSILLNPLGLSVALLTAREKGKIRQQILTEAQDGSLNILIGTHALLQNTVEFKALGLVIVDEQHRFGVEQRLALSAKGLNPHILSMTATPIPRTLALAHSGDMQVSTLAGKPANRLPIVTSVLSLERLDEVLSALEKRIAANQQIYWVCPLVEESEVLDLMAATERYTVLKELFPGKVAMVHGKMSALDKELAMQQFCQGHVNILVATTVIEVGINVPSATVMIIEHAERFGLAQLHQLRGRVGRGSQASFCLLLYGHPLTALARQRLKVMRNSEDGFFIAEQDLKLRGGGEILGTRQSGLPKFRLFDSQPKGEDTQHEQELYAQLFSLSSKEAKRIVLQDPDLQSERGQALQILLSLFGYDRAVHYRRAG